MLRRLCQLLLGEVEGSLHPLLDFAYIRAQPGGRDLSPDQILALACEPDLPLPFSPHPLFCVEDYSRRNGPVSGNALLHYLRGRRGAAPTHPLLSPAYVHAQQPGVRAGPRRTFLEAYLATWPDAPADPSLFVDVKHLNHRLAQMGHDGRGHPLCEAARLGATGGDMLHPDLDARLLRFAFGDLAGSPRVPDLLRAALDLEPRAAPAGEVPVVSAVMATYHKPVYTALSVLAALRALAPLPHEILVVENGGELVHHEELLRLLAPHPQVRMIRLEDNRWFGEASNIGAEIARGAHVLFLNNDCLLAPDYGERLLELISRTDRRFDALGAALVFPDGRIQEYGGVVGDDGQVVQRAKHLPPDFLDSLPELEEVDYASATCLCVSRAALNAVGGFDPVFEPFYFEDTDLCRRLAKAGLKVHVSRRLRAMHVENGSTRDFLGAGFESQITRNREAFARRWLKGRGEDAYLAPPALPAAAPSISRGNRLQALVYTPFDITPGGGERYLLSAARKLSETHDVVLATRRRMSRARVEFTRHALGVRPFPYRVERVEDAVSRAEAHDVAFIMGNEIAPPLVVPARVRLFHLQFPFPWRIVGETAFDRLEPYDAVVVNSTFTCGWTRERLREGGVARPPPLEVLAPPVQPSPMAARVLRRPGGPVRLANVGRFFRHGHCKRQDVALRVVESLRAAGVGAELTLVGSVERSADAQDYYAEVAAQARRLGGVEIIRDAGRSELAQVLARTDVYLHCCGFGVDTSLEPEAAEHFGVAVVEALQAGCWPLVADAGGPPAIVREAGWGASFQSVDGAVRAIEAALAEGRLDRPEPRLTHLNDAAFDEGLARLLQHYGGS